MIIARDDIEFEPEGFTPGDDQFTVFIDNEIDSDNFEDTIVGCANILNNNICKDATHYWINYIESYNGAYKIINYLMNNSENVTIEGESYYDTVEFWVKMGARFEYSEIIDDDNLYYFSISKEDFMKTKYYTELR